ncbi:11693_t:CDS:2, partial [Scutellospora calospora]
NDNDELWNGKAKAISFPVTFPQYNETSQQFICPPAEYSDLNLHTTFFSQSEVLISIAFLIFTIAIYGTKSIFSYSKTCRIDDNVILISSLAPILPWYTLAKPFWYVPLMCVAIMLAIYHYKSNSHSWLPKEGERKPHKRSRLITSIVFAHFFHSIQIICYDFMESFFFEKINTLPLSVLLDTLGTIKDIQKHGHGDKVYAGIEVKDINDFQEIYIEFEEGVKLKHFKVGYVDDAKYLYCENGINLDNAIKIRIERILDKKMNEGGENIEEKEIIKIGK